MLKTVSLFVERNEMDIVVCRKFDDCNRSELAHKGRRQLCSSCDAYLYVEPELRGDVYKCIYCAAKEHPNMVLFVELEPDEYGSRSMAKGIQEILEAKNGEWHKTGIWHNQKTILSQQ